MTSIIVVGSPVWAGVGWCVRGVRVCMRVCVCGYVRVCARAGKVGVWVVRAQGACVGEWARARIQHPTAATVHHCSHVRLLW
jgi:hypothetical protein